MEANKTNEIAALRKLRARTQEGMESHGTCLHSCATFANVAPACPAGAPPPSPLFLFPQ